MKKIICRNNLKSINSHLGGLFIVFYFIYLFCQVSSDIQNHLNLTAQGLRFLMHQEQGLSNWYHLCVGLNVQILV